MNEEEQEESDSQGSTSELNDRHQIQEFDPISVLPLLPAMIEERGIEFKEQRSSSPENGKSKQKFNFSPGEDGEDGDMGGESDESELTEQEDDEQDLDSDPEDGERSLYPLSLCGADNLFSTFTTIKKSSINSFRFSSNFRIYTNF